MNGGPDYGAGPPFCMKEKQAMRRTLVTIVLVVVLLLAASPALAKKPKHKADSYEPYVPADNQPTWETDANKTCVYWADTDSPIVISRCWIDGRYVPPSTL